MLAVHEVHVERANPRLHLVHHVAGHAHLARDGTSNDAAIHGALLLLIEVEVIRIVLNKINIVRVGTGIGNCLLHGLRHVATEPLNRILLLLHAVMVLLMLG